MSQGWKSRPPSEKSAENDPEQAKPLARSSPMSDPMAGVRGERESAAAQISRTMKVWRKAGAGDEEKDAKAGADAAAGDAGDKVSQPGEPAEKEADAVADKVAGDLHGGGDKDQDEKKEKKGDKKEKGGEKKKGAAAELGDDKKEGEKKDEAAGEKGDDKKEDGKDEAAGKEQAPAIGAKLEAPRIFRKAGDPKSVAELVTKLTGKGLEAYNQMKTLEQDPAINGICASSKVKQDDGTLNVVAAQSAFEAKWLEPAAFASKKLMKDNAFKKKIDDALSAIKNSCDETDGKNRPNAKVGDGTSEAALLEECKTGKPVVSQDGHYQKVPNYTDTISKNVALLEAEKAKITDAPKLLEIDAAITRGKERIAKMQPAIDAWKARATSYPAIWKSDGDSKVQPGFPKVK